MKPTRQGEGGFAIISAIFIVVVLALLGAFAARISGTQHIGSALDLQSARVLQAARSGLEWGMYQWAHGASYTCPATTNLAMPGTATSLAGITVTVTCTSTGTTSGSVARVTAVACTQPNAGACPNQTNPNDLYVERQVEVSLQVP